MKWHGLFSLTVALLLAASACSNAADDTKEEAIKKDRKKYEGVWLVVSLEVDGNKSEEEDIKKITIINDLDGKWIIELEGKPALRGTSEIDPTQKLKTVNLTITEGDDAGKTALGIYEFSEDTRKVCFAPPGQQDRPTEFASPAGSERILAILKRVKK